MWDLPGPGLEPVSPALAGGFLTTEPPGKPFSCFLKQVVVAFSLQSSLMQKTYDVQEKFNVSMPHLANRPGLPGSPVFSVCAGTRT